MNYDLNSINESFMHKIKKVQGEKMTDNIIDKMRESDEPIKFSCPALGEYLAMKYNHGHPFTVQSASTAEIEININDPFQTFEEKMQKELTGENFDFELQFRYAFNEFKYFKNAHPVNNSSDDSFFGFGCNADHLTEITFPDTWAEIPDHMFEGCSHLQIINFPESIRTIGAGAFSECSSIVDIIIPSTIKQIGNLAFSQCQPAEVIFEERKSPITIGMQAFNECTFWHHCITLPWMKNYFPSMLYESVDLRKIDISSQNDYFDLCCLYKCFNNSEEDNEKYERQITFHSKVNIVARKNFDLGNVNGNVLWRFPKKYREFYESQQLPETIVNKAYY